VTEAPSRDATELRALVGVNDLGVARTGQDRWTWEAVMDFVFRSVTLFPGKGPGFRRTGAFTPEENYSTVTLFARFLGWSTSVPFRIAQ
jgi:hypothetical protein